jgi:hypothetical protein
MALSFTGNENSVKQDVAQYVRDCLAEGHYPSRYQIETHLGEEIEALLLTDQELCHGLVNHSTFYMSAEIGEYATDVRSALDHVYRETLREELADFAEELADEVYDAEIYDNGMTHECTHCGYEADGSGGCPETLECAGEMEELDPERNITGLAALIDVELATWLI